MFLHSLALSYRELGDFEAAISTGTQSLSRFKAAEADFETATIENELALVYLAIGSLDAARTHAAEAREYFVRRDDTRWLAHVTETEGQIALAGGLPEGRDRPVHRVPSPGRGERQPKGRDQRRADAGARPTGRRRPRCRRRDLETAVDMAEGYGRRGQLQTLLGEWSDVMAARGDLAQAYALSRRAIDIGRR